MSPSRPHLCCFEVGADVIFPFPGTINSTGERSKQTFNIYLFSWHTEGIEQCPLNTSAHIQWAPDQSERLSLQQLQC